MRSARSFRDKQEKDAHQLSQPPVRTFGTEKPGQNKRLPVHPKSHPYRNKLKHPPNVSAISDPPPSPSLAAAKNSNISPANGFGVFHTTPTPGICRLTLPEKLKKRRKSGGAGSFYCCVPDVPIRPGDICDAAEPNVAAGGGPGAPQPEPSSRGRIGRRAGRGGARPAAHSTGQGLPRSSVAAAARRRRSSAAAENRIAHTFSPVRSLR